MENTKFVPELNKLYHIHVEGIKRCFVGTFIAVTRDWGILEEQDGVQQALPLELVAKADELQETELDSAKLDAIKTLIPNMPEELAAEMLKVLEAVQSGDSGTIEVLLKGTVRH